MIHIEFVGGPLDGQSQDMRPPSHGRGLPDLLCVTVTPGKPDDPHDPHDPRATIGDPTTPDQADATELPHRYHLRRHRDTDALVYVHTSRLPR